MNFAQVYGFSYSLDLCLQDQNLNYDTYIYRKSEHQWSKKADYSEWSLGKEIGINTLKHIIMHGNVCRLDKLWFSEKRRKSRKDCACRRSHREI